MAKSANEQISLKPQDVLIALKVAASPGRAFTYAALANELGMSSSQVHAGVKRAHVARILSATVDEGISPIRPALQEFVIYGLRYAFPATTGAMTRGIPTAFAAPPLEALIAQQGQVVPVWPHPKGSVRGYALFPLYPTIPDACELDQKLYEIFTLIDALRIGAARERELAIVFLKRYLQ